GSVAVPARGTDNAAIKAYVERGVNSMRCAYRLLLILMALPASASELTIARIFGDPALSGPTPRAVQVSPDGRRVGLLRGRDDDQHQLDLWSYDIADGSFKLRVDSKQL